MVIGSLREAVFVHKIENMEKKYKCFVSGDIVEATDRNEIKLV